MKLFLHVPDDYLEKSWDHQDFLYVLAPRFQKVKVYAEAVFGAPRTVTETVIIDNGGFEGDPLELNPCLEIAKELTKSLKPGKIIVQVAECVGSIPMSVGKECEEVLKSGFTPQVVWHPDFSSVTIFPLPSRTRVGLPYRNKKCHYGFPKHAYERYAACKEARSFGFEVDYLGCGPNLIAPRLANPGFMDTSLPAAMAVNGDSFVNETTIVKHPMDFEASTKDRRACLERNLLTFRNVMETKVKEGKWNS